MEYKSIRVTIEEQLKSRDICKFTVVCIRPQWHSIGNDDWIEKFVLGKSYMVETESFVDGVLTLIITDELGNRIEFFKGDTPPNKECIYFWENHFLRENEEVWYGLEMTNLFHKHMKKFLSKRTTNTHDLIMKKDIKKNLHVEEIYSPDSFSTVYMYVGKGIPAQIIWLMQNFTTVGDLTLEDLADRTLQLNVDIAQFSFYQQRNTSTTTK